MSDVEALHAEVVGLLDALRDHALRGLGRLGPGLAEHYGTVTGEAMLLLVGDDGDLRKRAQRDLDGLRRHVGTRNIVCGACVNERVVCPDALGYLDDLTSLRDTLLAMRDAS